MIGGNTRAEIQVKNVSYNTIGEMVESWNTALFLFGFLDYISGESYHDKYNAKIQESDHIFISDYMNLANVEPSNSRMIIGGIIYDITLIDNPMGMNRQLEIYLKKVEG